MVYWIGTDFDDTYTAPSGQNTLMGGAGNDSLTGNTDKDYILGGDGNDTLKGGGANDTLHGEAGNDEIYGGDGDDVISGGDGNDSIAGGNNNDTIYGGAGNDLIYGNYNGTLGSDVLSGGPGNDVLYGGEYADTYLFDFSSGGMDVIIDAGGEYDELNVSGVTNINQLVFFHGDLIGRSHDSMEVATYADAVSGTLNQIVEIQNFWSGGGSGSGQIEHLYVGGTTYWLPRVSLIG